MTTIAWWHCFAGIAGDMALGSLIDAGADLALVERELATLPVGGWELDVSPVLRAGVAATEVRVKSRDSQVVRTYSHIVGVVTEARLPERARQRALATFERLAEVEGRLHRRPPAQVHFHELGSTDAIVDIVGTCVALEVLGIDDVRASPVALGSGVVHTSHGTLPVPPPAVAQLLRDAPAYGTSLTGELTTPTGAALLAALASGFGPMPEMEVSSSGYGAGSRELDGTPNVLQVVIGHAIDSAQSGARGQPVLLLEANVDDVTGEILATTVAALIGAGALDAWITPVTGKKGRPAHVVSALCEEYALGRLRQVLADETGTLGMRAISGVRWPSERHFGEVDVEGYAVKVKRGPWRIKAEHDDAARVARLLKLPVREVARRAEETAHRVFGDGPGGSRSPGGPAGSGNDGGDEAGWTPG